MQSGLMSIVGTRCKGGDTAAYWVVAGADDTYQYTIFGGTAEAAQRNGAGEQHRVPARGHVRRPELGRVHLTR